MEKVKFKVSPTELLRLQHTILSMMAESPNVSKLHVLLMRKFYKLVSVKAMDNSFYPKVRTLNIPVEHAMAFCDVCEKTILSENPYTMALVSRFMLEIHPKTLNVC